MSAGKYRKEQNCLNCGFHVEEHYCSRCGQPNLELKENFWHFVGHSVAHYFHFDNKFFQTLVPLVSKPGKVTLDYLAGRRARYINPVSMYIFVSIVYFLVVYSPKHESHDNEKAIETVHVTDADLLLVDKDDGLDSLENPLKEAGVELPMVTDALHQAIIKKNFTRLPLHKQDSILRELQITFNAKPSDSLRKIIRSLNTIHDQKNDSTYSAYLARQQNLPETSRDNWLKRLYKKREIELHQKSDLIGEQLEHNRPKQYFMLMPLMALFILINFRKNHIYYLDHLIFTIHGMTAFFLVNIFTQPLITRVFGNSSAVGVILSMAVIVWVCWYMYKALRIFYQRKPWPTLWRMLFIVTLYGLALKITESVMMNLIYYIGT